MKKSTISSYLLLGMTALSLLCYVYLHKIAFETTGHCPSAKMSLASEENDNKTSKLLLPEISLVKHILFVTKTILTKE
jgi:hypothetical protein